MMCFSTPSGHQATLMYIKPLSGHIFGQDRYIVALSVDNDETPDNNRVIARVCGENIVGRGGQVDRFPGGD